MHDLNVGLAAVGGLIVVLGLVSKILRRVSIPEPLAGLAAGIVLGPAVLDLLDPAGWGHQETILEQAARVTLAIGLMAVALRLPKGFPLVTWRSLAALLTIGMLAMWLSTSVLVSLLLGLPFWVALLVGAVMTPTDPVVAASIVTGDPAQKNIPYHLRHLLSTESGANDGLAYPFVLLPILVLTKPAGEGLAEWLVHVLLREVLGAAVIGALLGYAAGRLLRWAEAHGTIEQPSFLAYAIALALLSLGSAKLLGTDGIFAVFVAGVAFDTVVGGRARADDESVLEAVNRFFTLPIFVLLGLALPWREWLELGPTGLALAAAVLLLRRLPWILAMRPVVPRLYHTPDALFLGWFGPIGVAALFYATLAVRRTGFQEAWTVGSLLICASLLVHGLSATPLTRLYGRQVVPSATDVTRRRPV